MCMCMWLALPSLQVRARMPAAGVSHQPGSRCFEDYTNMYIYACRQPNKGCFRIHGCREVNQTDST
jgi:hypothetical protein